MSSSWKRTWTEQVKRVQKQVYITQGKPLVMQKENHGSHPTNLPIICVCTLNAIVVTCWNPVRQQLFEILWDCFPGGIENIRAYISMEAVSGEGSFESLNKNRFQFSAKHEIWFHLHVFSENCDQISQLNVSRESNSRCIILWSNTQVVHLWYQLSETSRQATAIPIQTIAQSPIPAGRGMSSLISHRQNIQCHREMSILAHSFPSHIWRTRFAR